MVLLWTTTTTILILLSNPIAVTCLDNGLALTPPMGWLSWERFGCQTNCIDFPDSCISERLYLTQAQLLVDLGLQGAGYEYVNIDDCWMEKQRDKASGKLVADKRRFPNGIHSISKTLHSWGLKLGLYGDIGTKTCVGFPGFYGHFELDAQTIAEWEVDSIKVDACNANETLFPISYPSFGKALNKTGRPVMYSCSWPNDYYERHNHWEDPDYLNHGIKQTCNIWRNYFDISDTWASITKIVNFWARDGPQDTMVRAAGPGHFNDPDMLVIGNPGLSISEQQAQFSLWAIFAAPLIISADLRIISKDSLDILTNKEIIAVNQDELGRQGWCAENDQSSWTRIWVRELEPTKNYTSNDTAKTFMVGSSDRWAVVLENYSTIFNFRKIVLEPKRHLRVPSFLGEEMNQDDWTTFSVRDLVQKEDLGVFRDSFSAVVDESSVAMFLITRTSHPIEAALSTS